MATFTIPTIPGEFHWHIPPLEWGIDPTRGLSILAGPLTDWFNDPAGISVMDTAPVALFTPPDDNFILSAKVSVAFESDFDAGVLQVRTEEGQGAKLCFEYSPQRQPMIVSVVTRGRSDDCNSVDINGTEIYLRLALTPQTVAFHYSLDGRAWHFVRYFSLGQAGTVQAGFSAQSPRGAKCSVVFSEIIYRQGTLKDNRSGE